MIDILEKVKAEKEDFFKTFDAKKFVTEKLTAQADNILMKLLGFDSHWGRASNAWEVDHCNGRNGNSFIGQAISEAAKVVVSEMLKEALDNYKPLTVAAKNSIRKEYTAKLQDILTDLALKKARTDANQMINTIVSSTADEDMFIIDYDKAKRLALYEKLKAEFDNA